MRNKLKSLVGFAAVLTAASAVHAGMFTQPGSLTSGTITVSNITETNNTTSDKYYGAASLSGTLLSFPITGTLPFMSSSSGAGDSDILDVKLSFDVTSTAPLAVAAFLDEVGDYFGGGTGTGGDGASILIFGPNDTLLTSATSTFTAAPGTASTVWENSAGTLAPLTALGLHVVIDNVLHTASIAPTDYALIEKKGLTVNLGSPTKGGAPGTPEPASLGLLGLGAVALIGRRRKA